MSTGICLSSSADSIKTLGSKKIDLSKLVIREAVNQSDFDSAYIVLQQCANHLYTKYGLTNWYPLPPQERYFDLIKHCKTYCIICENNIIGTFNLTSTPRPYYHSVFDTTTPALYLGKLAVNPTLQQQGIGSCALRKIEELVIACGYSILRFDCIERNPFLKQFYLSRNYTEKGIVEAPAPTGRIICFEKILT